jgi:hypothetical protein
MQDSIAGFVGGAIVGTLGGIRLFSFPVQIHTGNVAGDMALDFAVKVIGTVILGLVGGLTGMATKDLYKHLKSKWKKNE